MVLVLHQNMWWRQMKQHIKEIIVVEGKNDTNTLQSFFDCDTIETGGDQVNEKTIERVRQAQKTRGVIIFTDPDTPGEHIRRLIGPRMPSKPIFRIRSKASMPCTERSAISTMNGGSFSISTEFGAPGVRPACSRSPPHGASVKALLTQAM